MASMEALLKIKATTEGQGAIASMARGLGGLKAGADNASGGLNRIVGAAGGLSGALGALAAAVTGVGLVAMAQGAINAADDMNDLAQKTGVSVEQLSRFKQAADASGTSIESVGGAMLRLGRNMATDNSEAILALQRLGISAMDASGNLRNTDQVMLDVADRFATMPDGAEKSAIAVKLFGRAGADMIPLLNGGRAAVEQLSATMSTKFAKNADELNDKMVNLQTRLTQFAVTIGTALLPVLNIVADAVIAVANGFAALPGPIQAIVAGVVALTAAFVYLAPAISAIVSLAGVLSGLQIGATIASWLVAVGPFIVGFQAALTGLLTWIGSVFIPGLLAFFSGPVGWTVLAVAAVAAMVILFRQPLTNFFRWLWEWGKPIRQFWLNLWNGAAGFAKTAFELAAQTVKNIFRGILQYIADRINTVSGLINVLIKAYNKLPAPDIGLIPPLAVPKFAEGGFVNRPTLGLVGEAGREYIIPESKMAAASSRFLTGARGSAVLAGNGGKAPVINITTGPVMEFDGQRYVTVTDMERAMRLTAEGVIGRLRTPSARIAMGMAR